MNISKATHRILNTTKKQSLIQKNRLCFFCCHFNYTKADYNALTMREKAFIYKAWEDKQVCETSLINKAVSNAVSNVLRKKNSKAIPLWKRKPRKGNTENGKRLISEIKKIEKSQGTSWIDKFIKQTEWKGG